MPCNSIIDIDYSYSGLYSCCLNFPLHASVMCSSDTIKSDCLFAHLMLSAFQNKSKGLFVTALEPLSEKVNIKGLRPCQNKKNEMK